MEKNFDETNTHNAAADLSNIIKNAAAISLKSTSKRKTVSVSNVKNKKKNKNLKWYDFSLQKARLVLMNKEKLFRKYSNDPYVRSSFYKTLKEFRKLRKHKLRQYRQGILDKLDSMRENNPSSYWKLLDELKNSDKIDKSENISSSEWIKHFSALNEQDSIPNSDILDKLRDLEKEKVFNELDYLISEKEISSCIKDLKNKKSSGCDSILNEMLKYGHYYLLQPLKKLFNLVLCSSKYPSLWSAGIITPLHKKGSLSDPSNYRGITISSCIGKLFNKILNNRLMSFLEKRDILCKEQIGFIKGNRTTDHMFILKNLIDRHTHKGATPLYTCFVDFRRAFDSLA